MQNFKIHKSHPNPNGRYYEIILNPYEDLTQVVYTEMPQTADDRKWARLGVHSPHNGELVAILSLLEPDVYEPDEGESSTLSSSDPTVFKMPPGLPLYPSYKELKNMVAAHVSHLED